jgi:phosphoglycolate phosphatase
MIRAMAFDLDGTLIDTAPDLAASINDVLRMIGHRPLPRSIVPRLIGAGLSTFVERALELSTGEASLTPAVRAGAEAMFRQLYSHHLFERSTVYPGVRRALSALSAAGMPLCCVTNKESAFALRLLEAADLNRYFQYILCGDLAENRKPSPNMLLDACRRADLEPEELAYVGDSRADIIAARAAGCRAIAVAYGYESPHALEALHPDELIDNLAELTGFIRPPLRGCQTRQSVSE